MSTYWFTSSSNDAWTSNFDVFRDPKCRILSAPPDRLTYSCSRPARISRRNENKSMKFDLPDPFAPITTLMGSRGKRSMRLMLLNPYGDPVERGHREGGSVYVDAKPLSVPFEPYGCPPALSAASLASIARAPDSELGME